MLLGLNLLVFAFGSVLCAIAPNYEVLVGARFLVGLGLGGEIATAVIMLAEFFSAKHRGTAVGSSTWRQPVSATCSPRSSV